MERTRAGLRPVEDSVGVGGGGWRWRGGVLGQEVSVFEDLLRRHKICCSCHENQELIDR